MYRILTENGANVYYQGDADYAAFDIECRTAKGDAGYLKFTMPKDNPMHGKLVTRKTVLAFVVDGEEIGRFEVRELDHDIYGNEQVYAVGELAWLYDSIQPQAEFHNISPRNFLSRLLSVHNSQCTDHQFMLGAVDVTDPNDSLYRYTNRETTLDDIRDKLVDRLGGQIRLRRVGNDRYIDYLTDDSYGAENTQRVYFGENLMDYCDNMSASDVCSEVVPLGCRLENSPDNTKIGNLEQRLTIESVNNGKDWVSNGELVTRFGHVRTTHVWDDVTMPENLLSKAHDWLASEQYERMHLTVKAVDLSLTSTQFQGFRVGDMVLVVAEPYKLKRRFPVTVRTYHPDSPESDTMELGDNSRASYVETQNKTNKLLVTKEDESDYRQTQWLTDAIDNVTQMMTGARGGYKLTEYDEYGRWLADYYLDSDDKDTARYVHKINLDGDAYSTNGINGPYETAIMANGTILGKFIQAHSVKAEQINQDYTSLWEDADARTLNLTRTEFKAADQEIAARVTNVETSANKLKTDLAAEVKVRADQIATTVKRGEINSTISQTAETIYIKSNKFGWESTNSSLTTNGTLTAKNASLTSANVSGEISCESSSSRMVMKSGAITCYAKKNGTWTKGAEITTSLGTDPWFNIKLDSGSYHVYQQMWAQEVLFGAKQGTNLKSELQLRKNYAYIDSQNGSSSSGIEVSPTQIELRTYPSGVSRAGITVTSSSVSISGNCYVNGVKIG